MLLQAIAISGCDLPIFPNLRNLAIIAEQYMIQDSQVVESILGPGIGTLTLEYPGAGPEMTVAVSSTTRALKQAKLPITKLTICPAVVLTQETCDALAHSIASFPSLQSLGMLSLYDALTVQLFAEASRLPQLGELIIRIPSSWIGVFEGVTGGFSALRRLEASSPHVLVGPLLSSNQPTLLVGVIISIWGSPAVSSFVSLATFVKLRDFKLAWSWGGIPWGDIVPLLRCPLLEELRMEGPEATSIFDDTRLLMAAQAWPRLRVLQVEEDRELETLPEDLEFPSVTLQGLGCLATHCPLLEFLTISVDACAPAVIPTVQSTSVKHLAFHRSPIDGPVNDVAWFISRMWPNIILKNVSRDPCYSDRAVEKKWPGSTSRWRQVWEKVAEGTGQNLAWPVSCSASGVPSAQST